MEAMLQGKHFEKPPDDKMQNAMKTLLDIASERTGVQGSQYDDFVDQNSPKRNVLIVG